MYKLKDKSLVEKIIANHNNLALFLLFLGPFSRKRPIKNIGKVTFIAAKRKENLHLIIMNTTMVKYMFY